MKRATLRKVASDFGPRAKDVTPAAPPAKLVRMTFEISEGMRRELVTESFRRKTTPGEGRWSMNHMVMEALTLYMEQLRAKTKARA